MITSILASTPTSMETGAFFCSNRQYETYHRYIPHEVKLLFICSDPKDPKHNDEYCRDVKAVLEEIGFYVQNVILLDGRSENRLEEYLRESNVIYLAGGHVPTQSEYFRSIHLAELLLNFSGTVIGCSAGSMNAASTVYAEPELDGEATDPNYQLFIPGLGLTDTMIIPHAYSVMNGVLDGKKRLEEIVFPDSAGKCFLLLPDGSYLLCTEEEERVFGEAYLIADGAMKLFCTSSGSRQLKKKTEE
ncbi:MAG: Type 1 glutamine amidotransferase-like domain-containing protein [Oscillospiraceae bacterium]|nr:Type 1 glutamine amidotransferase-like domain-containing protein [Oscillospiraceae bacterium]